MEKSGKRGKIPQSDWPLIMARYEAGETLASIARTYDCSPPAISYIVSRSRARQPAVETPPPVAEPQLVKAHPGDLHAAHTGNGAGDRAAPPALPEAAHPGGAEAHPAADSQRSDELPRQDNGFRNGERPGGMAGTAARPLPPRPNPAAQLNGEHRRTLHLSLGGNGGNGANGHAPPEPAGNGVRNPAADRQYAPPAQPPSQPYPRAVSERQEPRQPPRDQQSRYGFPAPAGERSAGDMSARADAEAARRKDTGTFIDRELRARVDNDIAAFLAAFDAALAGDTQESRSALREATDRLLRAGARTRIELERLEARVPLPVHESDRRSEPNWRPR